MTIGEHNQEAASSPELGVEELFQTAALILASQEEAVAAFEKAVAVADVEPAAERAQVYRHTRELLTQLAVERAIELDPVAFTPEAIAPASDVCLDTDDWEATGLTASQLTDLVTGTGRTRLRDWLEHLRPASRVIFVLRAILGKDSPEVAAALGKARGGAPWTPAQVGQVFRGALCSLATSLVHAPVAP
jgi:DNA-directed RNA polymerase specialized sigma24 family protein